MFPSRTGRFSPSRFRSFLALSASASALSLVHCGGSSSSNLGGGTGGGVEAGSSTGGTSSAGGAGTGGTATSAAGGVSATGGSSASSGGSATEGGTPVDLTEVGTRIGAALCGALARCDGPVLPTLLNGMSCSDFVTLSLENGEFSLTADAIARGTVHYDPSRLDACVASLGAAPCSTITNGTLCAQLLHGSVVDGRSCSFNGECSPTSFCKWDTTCPGTCAPRLPSASACRRDSDCQAGLTCDNTSKRCKASDVIDTTAKDGDPCDPATLKLCAAGLSCAVAGVSDAGAAVFKCEAPSTAPCHVAFPDECPDGQYCYVGSCGAKPKPGEACGRLAPSSNPSICATGAVCDDASGNCVKINANGGVCSADSQCYSGQCSGGVCVPPKCVAP